MTYWRNITLDNEVKDILVNCCDGGLVNVTHATDESLNQVQMAKALQRLCRFGGQCKISWQVAQHSLLVAEILKDKGYKPITQLAGLIHDFSESYINDITTPIKRELPDYYKYEKLLQDSIMRHYGLEQLENYPEYAEADEFALKVEAFALIGTESAWAKMDPKRFSDPRVFRYTDRIKTEQSDIVTGKLLLKLAELLQESGLYIPEVFESYWYRDWYKANQVYGDLYTRIIPVIAYNKQVYLLGSQLLSYTLDDKSKYADEFVEIIRTDKSSQICKIIKNRKARMQMLNHINELANIMYYASSRKDMSEFDQTGNINDNKQILRRLFHT